MNLVGGCSEIATLRNPETNHTWRIIAAIVGIIFFLRWIVNVKVFIRSENTSITVKNDDEVKDLDAGIEDLELKVSNSAESSTETFEDEYPILDEAVSVLRQPSGTIVVESPTTPSSTLDLPKTPSLQPTGILHRQVSVRKNSPPPSPKHLFQIDTPQFLRKQLEP